MPVPHPTKALEYPVLRRSLVKGTMHLVDEAHARELYDAMGSGVELARLAGARLG